MIQSDSEAEVAEGLDRDEVAQLLEAVKSLTPPTQGDVDRIEIGGRLVDQFDGQSNPDKRGPGARAALEGIKPRLRALPDERPFLMTGRIPQADKDALTFTLRELDPQELPGQGPIEEIPFHFREHHVRYCHGCVQIRRKPRHRRQVAKIRVRTFMPSMSGLPTMPCPEHRNPRLSGQNRRGWPGSMTLLADFRGFFVLPSAAPLRRSISARFWLRSSSRARTSSADVVRASGTAYLRLLPRPDASTTRFFLVLVALVLVIEQELARRLQIGPAVGIQDGPVHRVVQLAELLDLGRGLEGVVEAVVNRGESFSVPHHEVRSESIVLRADLSGLLTPSRSRKRIETWRSIP